MNDAIGKTVSLILLILVGYILRVKISSKDQRNGIKEIILSVALPAMIFISLQKVQFEVEMIFIPLAALAFNFIMFYFADLIVPLFNIDKGTPAFRTFKMLIPSLAPGLSCFPFLLEYFGDEALASAALADVGNKIFVLIVLYLIGIKWYYQSNGITSKGGGEQLKSLFKSMVKEPVNLAIIFGLVILALGINYQSFPPSIKNTIDRLSAIMTPLILIFIGLSVKANWSQIRTILSVLLCKSALAFFLSGLFIIIFQVSNPTMMLLIILFPQSSFSFWPYAHMSAIQAMEQKSEKNGKTFDLDYAMNIMAFSLPFSTILILILCTFSDEVVANSHFSFLIGTLFIALAFVKPYISFLQKGIVFKTHTSDYKNLSSINKTTVIPGK